VDADGVTSIRQYNPAGESPDMEKSHSHEAEQACVSESSTRCMLTNLTEGQGASWRAAINAEQAS